MSASNWAHHWENVEGVNFSLIWVVILRAIRGLSTIDGSWVLRLKFGVWSEEEGMVITWIDGSFEISALIQYKEKNIFVVSMKNFQLILLMETLLYKVIKKLV